MSTRSVSGTPPFGVSPSAISPAAEPPVAAAGDGPHAAENSEISRAEGPADGIDSHADRPGSAGLGPHAGGIDGLALDRRADYAVRGGLWADPAAEAKIGGRDLPVEADVGFVARVTAQFAALDGMADPR
jgi:hypothetical protein